jgi:DNA-binding LacI/PurR family transcriptional regulator
MPRSVVIARSIIIGLVVPDNTSPLFAPIACEVEGMSSANHYNIFLVETIEDPAREMKAHGTF